MRVNAILLAGMLILASAAPGRAQPLARGDVAGTLGWFSANQSEYSDYNDWYNRSAYGGATLGWYWTDHLKTEVEVGATSPAELYGVQTIDFGGQPAYGSSQHRFSTRRFSAGQHYQFLRNAWVHPHVGVGADLTWQTHQQQDQPIMLYDQLSRTSRVVRQARTIGPSTELSVRPFAEVGTKLYLSRRGFFRTDLRMTFRDGVDEVLLRFGLGVDF
jgi:outer membrane protein W